MDVLASPDGSFYLAEAGAHRVSFVGTNGRLTVVAGDGLQGFSGDGGPAALALLSAPSGLASGPDGDLYVADWGNHRIRRIGTNGVISTVAGTGTSGFSGDGGPALAAELSYPRRVAAGADGVLYVVDQFNQRVRRIASSGRIQTVVGNDAAPAFADGDLALQTPLDWPTDVAVESRGRLLVADEGWHHVLEVTDSRPLPHDGELLVPDPGGSQVFVFSPAGRHLRTAHALTGTTLLSFEYDTFGRLQRIVDGNGNATEVLRDGSGTPTAIVGPYGQASTLTLDSFGYLAGATNQAGESTTFTSTTTGLLLSRTDAESHTKSFSWDSTGRLIGELDADGGQKSLSRWGVGNRTYTHYRVAFGSAEGRNVFHDTWYFWNGRRRWKSLPLGPGANDDLVTRTTDWRDGTSLREDPDGSTLLSLQRPDPVWGLNVQRFGSTGFATPGGLGRSGTSFAEATLADPLDPLSVEARVETFEIGGRTSTRTYDGLLRRWLATSATGRISRLDLDPLGRPVESAHGDLEPTRFAYDSNGRLTSVSSGVGAEERVVLFDYDSLGRLASIVDPLSREVSFEYDSANRVTLQVLPGGRELHFDWDQNGNLTGLAPPARPEHGFDHSAVDLVSEYAPPPLGPGSWSTLYEHNLDRQPTRVDRPDGSEIELGYDGGQRLAAVALSRGTTTIAYDTDTGHVASLTTPEGNALTYTMDGPVVLSEAWSGEIPGSVERTYDADLRLATISVNGANPVAYGYDDDGLLVQAGSLALTRSPQSGLLTATTIGVVTTGYAYNSFGELESMSAAVSGSPIYETTYTRDKLGRITTKVETIEGVTTTYSYGYDLAGRLDTVTIDGVLAADYDHDPNGNRTQKWAPGGTEAGSYDDQDRLLSYGGSTFTYRPSGELSTETAGAATTTYDYDALGNLLSVDLPDGTEIDYVVDARNRRIGRKVDGTLVSGLLWQSQLAPVAELDGAGNVVSRFVHATRVNVPDSMTRGGDTYRILTDHLGSPRLVIDTATGFGATRQRDDLALRRRAQEKGPATRGA